MFPFGTKGLKYAQGGLVSPRAHPWHICRFVSKPEHFVNPKIFELFKQLCYFFAVNNIFNFLKILPLGFWKNCKRLKSFPFSEKIMPRHKLCLKTKQKFLKISKVSFLPKSLQIECITIEIGSKAFCDNSGVIRLDYDSSSQWISNNFWIIKFSTSKRNFCL